jgi:hypothetical protein
MAMALIDSAVGREEVYVMLSLGIPNISTLGAGKDDGEGVVVVCGVFMFGLDRSGCGGGMVPGLWLERWGSRLESAAIGIDGAVSVWCHGY